MPKNVGSLRPDQQKWQVDILNSAMLIVLPNGKLSKWLSLHPADAIFLLFFVCSADLEKLCTRSFSPYVKFHRLMFMRDCLCLACVQTYPLSSVATKVIGNACTQASRGPTPTAALNRKGGHKIRSNQVSPLAFMTSTLLRLIKSHATSVCSCLQQFQESTECSLRDRRKKGGRGGEDKSEKR